MEADGYEDLYRLHRPRILRLCHLLLGDRAEADDVTQDVFSTLLGECRRVQDHPRDRPMVWAAWLTRVAVNACHGRRRSRWWRRWRPAAEPFEGDDVADPAPGPEGDAGNRETRRAVFAVHARLSLRQREVFLLRHLEGFTTEETAAALGLDPGTVKQHLFRANRAFRRALEPYR